MRKSPGIVKIPLNHIKETSWSTIAIFSLLYCLHVAFINLVVFKSNILQPIPALTFGLFNQTLTANLASILLFVFVIILMYGRLDFFDIGFKRNRLPSAMAAMLAIWIAIQLFNIAAALVFTGKPVIYEGWSKYGALAMIGNFIGQLFGNCLFEELAFRGFLLIQICKKLKNRKGQLLLGVAASQLLFALIHIPARMLSGMSILEMLPSLLIVFMLGMLFAFVYLSTDNIFLAIGLHTLWNAPLPAFVGYGSVVIVFIAMLLLPIFWDRSFGRLDVKYTAPLQAAIKKQTNF